MKPRIILLTLFAFAVLLPCFYSSGVYPQAASKAPALSVPGASALIENTPQEKKEDVKRNLFEKAMVSAVIAAIGIVLFAVLSVGLRRLEQLVTHKEALREDSAALRIKTLGKLGHWLGGIIIAGVVAYMVLDTFGFNVVPLLAGAGLAGLAFGFGGQYLIRDIINGLFILLEDQYRVNDVVKINEFAGLVEDVNLRITTLRDREGSSIIIPNGEIKTVVNFTRDYSYAFLNIGVAYKENVDRAMEVIRDIGKAMREDPYFKKLILEPLEMWGVDNFGESQVTIQFRIKTLPIKQWEVAREFRRRLKNKFDELGIEIPSPHRTLYFGSGSDNDWLKHFAQVLAAKSSQVKADK